MPSSRDLPSSGIEPRSPALQAILYHLSRQENPRIVEWVAISFSRGSLPSFPPRASVLAWRIPGTGEPGGLPSVGSHRVGHD